MILVVTFEHFLHRFVLNAASTRLANDCKWLSFEFEHAHVSLEFFFTNTLLHVFLEIAVQGDQEATGQELNHGYSEIPPDVEKCD